MKNLKIPFNIFSKGTINQIPRYNFWFSHQSADISGTLYERIGGKAVIEKSMKEFKLTMRAHPELEHYFIWKDEKKYIPGSTAYAVNSLGGPYEYSGRNLRVSHRALKISNHYFDLAMEILETAFKNNGVDEETVKDVIKHYEEHRIDITNKYVTPKKDQDFFEEYYNADWKKQVAKEEEEEKKKQQNQSNEAASNVTKQDAKLEPTPTK